MTAPVRTNIYTANGCYSISATILEMRGMMMRGEIEQHVFETIRSILTDLEVITNLMEMDDLIDDPEGGYMTLDAFFDKYGQYGINWDSDEVITIPDTPPGSPRSVVVVNHAVGEAMFYTPDDMEVATWLLDLMREGEIGVFPVDEDEIEDDLSDIVMDWNEN